MFDKPQAEHEWLMRLVGSWRSEMRCDTEDGQNTMMVSQNRAQALGGLWLQLEGSGDEPDGSRWVTQMTLGYDPTKQCYVGSFVGSMMTHLWFYDRGQVSADGTTLVLHTVGPSMKGEGLVSYQVGSLNR